MAVVPFKQAKPGNANSTDSTAGVSQKPGGGTTSRSTAELSRSLASGFARLGIESFSLYLLPIEEYLNGLADRASKRSVNEAAVQIQELSNEEIKALCVNSNKADWSKRPGYFRALVEVAKARGLA